MIRTQRRPLPHPDLAAFASGQRDDYPPALTEAWLVGTPDEVRAQIEARQALGVSHFLLWFMDAPAEDGLRLFAERMLA